MIHTLYVTGMHLFATVYSFVGQFSLRARNSSHLLFFGANFVFYAYCEEYLRYTLLYHAILSRYHCLDYPTFVAFGIQINYSEVFPIAIEGRGVKKP